MKPGDVVHAAVSRGGENVRAHAFDAATALLGYIDGEAGADAIGEGAARGTVFRALSAAFCAGYLHRESVPKREAS